MNEETKELIRQCRETAALYRIDGTPRPPAEASDCELRLPTDRWSVRIADPKGEVVPSGFGFA